MKQLKIILYFLSGMLFGIIFVKAEIISWFRIQEMFRFASFHMFGVIMTAIAVGFTSIQFIKIFKIKTLSGGPINIKPKEYQKGNIYGSLLFGIRWALTGACPEPLFAQLGSGLFITFITFLSALWGT